MHEIKINIVKELFRFNTQLKWAIKGVERLKESEVPAHNILAIDRIGRVCTIRKHFIRATKEKAYPIIAYQIN